MTALPNPFLNSVPASPLFGTDTAGVSPPPDASAGTISKSALASAMTADAAAGPEFADPPVPAAVLIAEPSMTNGGDQEAPASAPSKNPDVGVLADRIDWHEFFEAVMDERIVLFELYDEVPLFLRDGDHLRRWEA